MVGKICASAQDCASTVTEASALVESLSRLEEKQRQRCTLCQVSTHFVTDTLSSPEHIPCRLPSSRGGFILPLAPHQMGSAPYRPGDFLHRLLHGHPHAAPVTGLPALGYGRHGQRYGCFFALMSLLLPCACKAAMKSHPTFPPAEFGP